VAVTNDFSWVQITKADKTLPVVNPPAPPADGVRVTWRAAHGVPPRRPGDFRRLRAIEAVSGTKLTVDYPATSTGWICRPFPS
jgi:hypothetical protein